MVPGFCEMDAVEGAFVVTAEGAYHRQCCAHHKTDNGQNKRPMLKKVGHMV